MYLPQILALMLVLVLEVRGDYHEIDTKYGKIKGIVQTNELNDKKYYAFKKIPYAKAITEETKFINIIFISFLHKVYIMFAWIWFRILLEDLSKFLGEK